MKSLSRIELLIAINFADSKTRKNTKHLRKMRKTKERRRMKNKQQQENLQREIKSIAYECVKFFFSSL